MNWKRFIYALSFFAVLVCGTAIAGTLSDFTSGDIQLSKPAVQPTHNYIPFMVYRQFDFGHASLNAGSGVTDTDIIRLFNVKKNDIIEEIGIRVTTASVYSGVSAEIGDGNDIDGFVGNDITDKGVPFVDLSNTYSGMTIWNIQPYPKANASADGGSSRFMVSGVSFTVVSAGTGTTAFDSITLASNAGPYFTSGASPYVGDDTIDMTIYTGSNAHANKAGVTPVFEMYIRGYKRVPLP